MAERVIVEEKEMAQNVPPDGCGEGKLLRFIDLPEDAGIVAVKERVEELCKNIEQMAQNVARFKGRIKFLQDIIDVFLLNEKCGILVAQVRRFTYCYKDLDTKDPEARGCYQRFLQADKEYNTQRAFLEPEICELAQGWEGFQISSSSAQNWPAGMRTWLNEILAAKDYVADEETGKKLADLNAQLKECQTKFSADKNARPNPKMATGQGDSEVELSWPYYKQLVATCKDRELRKQAYLLRMSELQKDSMLALSERALNENFSLKLQMAKLQNFPCVAKSVLFEDKMSDHFFTDLYDKVVEKFVPINDQYHRFRASVLGLQLEGNEAYTSWDFSVPIFEGKVDLSLDGALDLMRQVVRENLTPGYLEKLEEVINPYAGCIDSINRPNKTRTTYSYSAYRQDQFVMISYLPSQANLLAIHHELGHAVQNRHCKDLPFCEHVFWGSLQEVPAKVQEYLLFESMFKRAKDVKEACFWADRFVSSVLSTIITQTCYSEMEFAWHEHIAQFGHISAEKANEIAWQKLCRYGNIKGNELDKGIWMVMSHFYDFNFYTYRYTYSAIVALGIIANLKSGRISKQDYEKFLASGRTQKPEDILASVGVNMNCNEPYTLVADLLEEKLAALINRYCL